MKGGEALVGGVGVQAHGEGVGVALTNPRDLWAGGIWGIYCNVSIKDLSLT